MAKERPQGRLPSGKNPLSPPVNIIEHADVRRMLLAQKAYAEGSYALCLLGTQLADDAQTAPTEEQRQQAHTLLDFLTPIIKTWPSEYGPQNNLAGYLACLAAMEATIAEAGDLPGVAGYAAELRVAITTLKHTTETLLGAMLEKNIDRVLSNSVKYLELFGNVVIAWLWLKQGIVATRALADKPHEADRNFYRGKVQAMRYFFRFELPEIEAWAKLLTELDDTCYEMSADWF